MTDRRSPEDLPAGGFHSPTEEVLPDAGLPFGRYRLLRRISYGGMGEIFLAKHDGPGGFSKLLVIKRLLQHYRDNDDIVAMFFDEARLQALMTDRHVVQIWDMGEADDQYFIAMEYVAGTSWRKLIARLKERGEHLHPAHVVDLAVQACRGLSYAHNIVGGDGTALAIVHRDVNPQNLLVSYQGECKIIDFGIAKSELSEVHTQAGTIKGKYAYMSPEQARAEPLDRRSDIFCLGICLYELVTTTNPFHRKNVVSSLEAICEQVPPPLESLRPATAPLAPIIERCLAKDPDERFADCAEVEQALVGLWSDGLCGEAPQGLGEALQELFAAEIEQQAQFLKERGFSQLSLLQRRVTPTSDAGTPSPYGLGSELTQRSDPRRRRSSGTGRSVSAERPAAPPSREAPQEEGSNTMATATLALSSLPSASSARSAEEDPGAPFAEPTLPAPVEQRSVAGMLVVGALFVLLLLVGGAFVLLGGLADPRPEALVARLEAKLAGAPDVVVEAVPPQQQLEEPPILPDPASPPVALDAGAAALDAGAAAVVDAGGAVADAGREEALPDQQEPEQQEPDEQEPEQDEPEQDEPAEIVAEEPAVVREEGDKRRGSARRARRARPRPPVERRAVEEPAAPAPAPAGMLTVNAGGPFPLKGRGVSARNTAKLSLAEGVARTLQIGAPAPLAVTLRVQAKGGRVQVSVDSEPWSIVRENHIGRGRTPQRVSVGPGERVRLSLKNPAAGEMEVTLGFSSTQRP